MMNNLMIQSKDKKADPLIDKASELLNMVACVVIDKWQAKAVSAIASVLKSMIVLQVERDSVKAALLLKDQELLDQAVLVVDLRAEIEQLKKRISPKPEGDLFCTTGRKTCDGCELKPTCAYWKNHSSCSSDDKHCKNCSLYPRCVL